MQILLVLVVVMIIWLTGLSLYLFLYLRPKSKPLPLSTTSPQVRFGLVRFNPFSDTGGEQSFVLSLLSGGGNGILLTSLHGRGITRIYAKRVFEGKTDQELSAEEKAALSKAVNGS